MLFFIISFIFFPGIPSKLMTKIFFLLENSSEASSRILLLSTALNFIINKKGIKVEDKVTVMKYKNNFF